MFVGLLHRVQGTTASFRLWYRLWSHHGHIQRFQLTRSLLRAQEVIPRAIHVSDPVGSCCQPQDTLWLTLQTRKCVPQTFPVTEIPRLTPPNSSTSKPWILCSNTHPSERGTSRGERGLLGLKIKGRNCCDELWTCSNTWGSLPAQQNVRWMLYFLAFQCPRLPVHGTGSRDLWCCPAWDSKGLAMAILGQLVPRTRQIKRGCLQALPPVPTPLLTLSEWNNPAHGAHTHGRRVGIRGSLWSCPTQTILGPQPTSAPPHVPEQEQLLAEQTWLCPQPQPKVWEGAGGAIPLLWKLWLCRCACSCPRALCVCVSVTVCVHLSPQDASPGRLRAGFAPLFRNVTGTGIRRDSDVPGRMQGGFQTWGFTGSFRLVQRPIIRVPPQVCRVGMN